MGTGCAHCSWTNRRKEAIGVARRGGGGSEHYSLECPLLYIHLQNEITGKEAVPPAAVVLFDRGQSLNVQGTHFDPIAQTHIAPCYSVGVLHGGSISNVQDVGPTRPAIDVWERQRTPSGSILLTAEKKPRKQLKRAECRVGRRLLKERGQ